MIIKTCDHCGEQFIYRGRHGTRNNHFFCCHDCYIHFKTKKIEVPCDLCGEPFQKKRSDIKRSDHNFCSEECYRTYMALNRESKAGLHYGGKVIYRMMMEHDLGRKLSSSEQVHHIDGNHKNNAMSNLQLVTRSEHQQIHAATKPRNRKGQFVRGEVRPDEVHST